MNFRKPRCHRCHRRGVPTACTVQGNRYCARCMDTTPGLATGALEEAWESMLATMEREQGAPRPPTRRTMTHPDMTGWTDRQIITYGILHDLRAAGCTCAPNLTFGDRLDEHGQPLPFTAYVAHEPDCRYPR